MAVRDPLFPPVPRHPLAAPPAASELAEAIGHSFARPELLEEALTHPSALSPDRRGGRRRPVKRNYERLEFLGDRVLGLVIADHLWHRFETEPEGPLTRRHNHLVRRETLARVAAAIGLGPHLVLSPAEAAAGAAANPAILADACEAVIAAIFLDGGFAAATEFVRRWWEPLLAEMTRPPRDAKTALQEWVQARGLPLPVYQLIAASGPDHALVFTIAVQVAGSEPAAAAAPSKRQAETKAAAALLAHLTAAG